MLALWNWYLSVYEDCILAHGIVTGHRKLPNGLRIHTSAVQGAEAAGDQLHLLTASGSRYTLPCQAISGNEERRKDTRACLDRLQLPDGTAERCLRLRSEAEARREAEASRTLPPGALLLEVAGTAVLCARFMTRDGTLTAIEPQVHVGMYQDSVLITDWENGTVDFRYFPMADRLEPYHLSNGLTAIRIHNLGSTDVWFGSSAQPNLCPAGERTEFPAADYSGVEGLFSPDAVDGKGLYQDLLNGD